MKCFLKIVLSSFLIYFFSWFLLYKTGINTLPIQSEDTISTMFTTVAIIQDKTLYLDKYYPMLIEKYPHPDDKDQTKGLVPFYLKKVNGHYLTAFPIITSILSIPVFIIPLSFGAQVSWDNLIIWSHVASSLIMAFSVWFFYLLVFKKFQLDEKKSFYLSLIFGFGTVNLAMFSQALWQFGTLQLFLILSLYFSFSKNNFWSGFFSAIAFLTRPTSILAIIFNPFIPIIFDSKKDKNIINYKKVFINFIFGFVFPVLFFIWYNNAFYRDFSNQGYVAQAFNSWLSHFPEGFLGIWISPSKGILIFTPVFIFSLVGLWISINNWSKNFKTKKLYIEKIFSVDFLYVIFGFIVVVHTFVMGFWKHWYGGYGFGYRMAGDVIPYLVLLLIPFLNSDLYKKYFKIFTFLVIISIFVQIYGLIFFDSIWHLAYDKGFKDTSWLWSLKDSEWAFNFRRILVKFGLLEQACPKCLPN